MAVLDIITYPDARLKQAAEEVKVFDSELFQFIQNLDETMAAGPGGVGIAATQVGVMQRIVIVDVSKYPKIKKAKHHGHLVLINPEIIDWQGMKKGGKVVCLCLTLLVMSFVLKILFCMR